DRQPAFLLRGDEREPHVPLAADAEMRAGSHDDAPLEQPRRERLRRLALWDGDPEVHRRRAAGDLQALAREQLEEELTLAPIALAVPLDVCFVLPGDDRRALDEQLRRRPDGWAELPQRRDRALVSGDEAGTVARH